MRLGEVNGFLEAVAEFRIYDSAGRDYKISAVIDTGFSEELSLAPVHVAGLGLPLKTVKRMRMANGGEEMVGFYEAEILWMGNRKTVEVCCTGDEALIGMSLLFLSCLDMHIAPRGQIFLF